VWGLVLAGGASKRMGEDKGSLDVHGQPQAVWVWQQLDAICERTFVSVNAAQQTRDPYVRLPTIIDEVPPSGPATGLISAWIQFPEASWLVVAADMPFLDRSTLVALLHGRDSREIATAFVHKGGIVEPLCAIWEAAAQASLKTRIAAGDASLRRCLEAERIHRLTPESPQALVSINSPDDYESAVRVLTLD
jgi:molybdenum cofactor guanylyltransferase